MAAIRSEETKWADNSYVHYLAWKSLPMSFTKAYLHEIKLSQRFERPMSVNTVSLALANPTFKSLKVCSFWSPMNSSVIKIK